METKTTLFLSDSVRQRLKQLAVRQRKTLKELVEEGAELVLARYQSQGDREELARRSAEAWARLEKGLYSGPPIAAEADAKIYSPGSPRRLIEERGGKLRSTLER